MLHSSTATRRNGMFELGTPLWEIAVRSAVVYVALFVALRLMGKRELGQMTIFDLVVILLVGNAVQNAMVGKDFSLQGGVLAAVVLLAANRTVALLRVRGGLWGRLIEGTPTVLVEDGDFIEPQLRKEGLDRREVEMVVREHGLESIAAVKLAVLETDGSISIVPMSSLTMRTPKHVRQMMRSRRKIRQVRRR
jgi:uncharacterized membrane protein YcaP (DUF421 family)